MSVKDQLHAAIDRLSEEAAAAVLLVLQRERDDVGVRRATAESLADDE